MATAEAAAMPKPASVSATVVQRLAGNHSAVSSSRSARATFHGLGSSTGATTPVRVTRSQTASRTTKASGASTISGRSRSESRRPARAGPGTGVLSLPAGISLAFTARTSLTSLEPEQAPDLEDALGERRVAHDLLCPRAVPAQRDVDDPDHPPPGGRP